MSLNLAQFVSTVRVLDGAWGTELQSMGLPAGACPELWNVENPDAVRAVADSYVQAGSDVIITNTFGANKFVLSQHGAENRVAELAESGASISRAAAGDEVKVFASIGPSGKVVMMQEVPQEQLLQTFADAAGAVERGGADAVVLETFNELDEITLALQAVKSACRLPVVCSMTYTAGPDGTATVMGNRPEQLVEMAGKHGADAVGANCGAGPEHYVKIVQLYRQATDMPVWVKANAGMPTIVDGKTTFPLSPQQFAACVSDLASAGANFIGGCCGTGPEHIRAIREAVDGL